MKLSREEEIEIIIKHLKEDVKLNSTIYQSLYENSIIKNGKAIEAYREEIKKLNNDEK